MAQPNFAQPQGYQQPQPQYGTAPPQGYQQPSPSGYKPPAYAGGQPVQGQPVPGQPVQQGYQQTPAWYQPPEKKGDLQEITDGFKAKWETPLLLAGFSQPLWCCAGFFCAPCASFMQRRKLLMVDKDENNWKYYQCCGGIMGQGCTSECKSCTEGNECCCLALEACCCLGCSVHGNRFMVQVHYGLENSCCDIFLFWLSCICQIACILQVCSFCAHRHTNTPP